jgi:4-alpha-glucanotransferase
MRSSGILLHPTSLPGPGGVGDLGAHARRFVDFLVAGKQTYWQMLPLNPIGQGNSPYAARSAFAGNPLLVDLEQLVERGWLERSDPQDAPHGPPERAQYEQAAAYKQVALKRAYHRFTAGASAAERQSLEEFCHHQRGWLDDFALFNALRQQHRGASWLEWDGPLAGRKPEALAAAQGELAEPIAFEQFAQYIFFQQWGALKSYANQQGLRLVGDIAIYVAHDSADVWANQELFSLDEAGRPTVVAGVPPDLFSATGQRWGNPLYRWDLLSERGFDWWIERFRAALQTVDVVRLDHFRGFGAYWEVPAECPTAEQGRWVKGPGVALFQALEAALGRVPMIVEDLGVAPEGEALREELGFPGMKVLQFAFDDAAVGEDVSDPANNPFLPHNYQRNFVVYTGTHDNDTTLGWFTSLDEDQRRAVSRYLGTDGQNIAWDLIRCALASVANIAIIPLQDILALGSEARMNRPGTGEGNWVWRYRQDQLRPDHAERLAELTTLYGRARGAQDAQGVQGP